MIKVVSYREGAPNTWMNTTSRSRDWTRGLSPFFVGPVDLYGIYTAKNVENGWQFSKVYSQHVSDTGDPTLNYFLWATNGWNDSKAHRYPMGKGCKPLYSWWDGRKLSYIEARRQIYAPLYAKAVEKTDAWKQLHYHYKMGTKIILMDFDGYDHRKLGMSYVDVLNCENRKMGHAFVLAMMLENQRVWES